MSHGIKYSIKKLPEPEIRENLDERTYLDTTPEAKSWKKNDRMDFTHTKKLLLYKSQFIKGMKYKL